jgi:hypothetical protein
MVSTSGSGSAQSELARYCSALKSELSSSQYGAIRHLVCRIDRDRITVQGTVPSFYMRQVAQSLVAKVVGIEYMRSEIDVQPEQVPNTEFDD